MFLDFRNLDDGTTLEADVCVIGGGAAGIAIAREFDGSAARVLLVESGGLEFDPDTQDLYAGTNVGAPYFDLEVTRLRFLGGTTNHWSGFCGPLDAMDFEERPWVPHSGWPIGKDDLEPFHGRASAFLGLGEPVFDERLWRTLGLDPLAYDRSKLRDYFWQMSWNVEGVIMLGDYYRDVLEASDTVRVVLNANVVNIRATEGARAVDHVAIRALDGRSGTVKARAYVLACGGIENARILLYSNDVQTSGLGNDRDLVGRFFMNHPTTRSVDFAVDGVREVVELYSKKIGDDGTFYEAGLRLAEETQREAQVLNAGGTVKYLPRPDSGLAAAQKLFRSLRRGQLPEELGTTLWRIARDLGTVVEAGYHRFVDNSPQVLPIASAHLECWSEQAPNPDSRVLLSAERDALGLPRAALDWRLTDQDRRTLVTFVKTAAAELARLNAARARLPQWMLDEGGGWGEDTEGDYHHVGTTRMADDPSRGVVDRDCRVHGIGNLYVAGSSVFPTSGFIAPTYTIVALAIRLADHLKARLV